jgi:hypothetical protein
MNIPTNEQPLRPLEDTPEYDQAIYDLSKM